MGLHPLEVLSDGAEVHPGGHNLSSCHALELLPAAKGEGKNG